MKAEVFTKRERYGEPPFTLTEDWSLRMDGGKSLKPEVQSLKNRKTENSWSLNSYEVKLEAETKGVKSSFIFIPSILLLLYLSFFFSYHTCHFQGRCTFTKTFFFLLHHSDPDTTKEEDENNNDKIFHLNLQHKRIA